jgi:hypothetical protein
MRTGFSSACAAGWALALKASEAAPTMAREAAKATRRLNMMGSWGFVGHRVVVPWNEL